MLALEVKYHKTSDPNWCIAKEFTVLSASKDDYIMYCGYALTNDVIGCTFSYTNACQNISTPREDWRRVRDLLFHFVEIKEGRTELK